MSKTFTFFSAALLVLPVQLTSALAADKEPVKEWLAGQAKIRSLKADFTQQRQVREGRRPIVTEGRFAFAAPGSFRWQMGEPAVTLAVQKKGGDLIVANVKRERATVYPNEVLKAEESAMGFSFIEAGFPRTLEEFEKNFSVKEVEPVGDEFHVTVGIKDKRTSVGLRKMVFYIAKQDYALRGFYLRFRDSSSITTRFTKVEKDLPIGAAEFELSLDGYEVTRFQKKR